MSNLAIQFDHVGKLYRLGQVGTGTLSHDLNRWWATKILHKEDPYLKIGETNDRSKKGNSEYVWALRDITFDVEQGDVIGIIGRNGAGKSTLLKLLSQITSPTTGVIRAKGRIGSLLEVGTGFHPEMTGRENIYMNGSIMGMTRQEISRKLDEIVDFAGVERYLDTPVKRYSSGMTVRLGFAVAAFMEPEILVVDEVLAVGDAEFQKKAIGKMQDVSRGDGRTVLFVSHNMGSVRKLCNKGILLENGAVSYKGTAEEIVDKYMQVSLAQKTIPVHQINRKIKGTGVITFTDVKYYNEKDERIDPHCGKFLKIRLFIKINKCIVKNCRFSIGIWNLFGEPMITMPTDLTINTFDIDDRKGYVDCIIPKFPLTVGHYKLALWVGSNGLMSDFIDGAINFDVIEDDYYCQGRSIPSHLCGKVVLCDHYWKID